MTVMVESNAWDQLVGQLGRLRAYAEQLGDTYRAVSDPDMSDGLGATLNLARRQLVRLDRGGDLGDAAIKDAPGAVATWVKVANRLGADLDEVAKDLKSRGWLSTAVRFWDEVVIQSVDDLGTGVTTVVGNVGDAINEPPSLLKWLVVGAVALAVMKFK